VRLTVHVLEPVPTVLVVDYVVALVPEKNSSEQKHDANPLPSNSLAGSSHLVYASLASQRLFSYEPRVQKRPHP
jgi:hypothetical protein